MLFSKNKLTLEEINIAEQEDEAACRDGRLRFLEMKYEYLLHTYPPSHSGAYHCTIITIDAVSTADIYNDYKSVIPEKDYIMPHGGYYAVIKECIARKKTWEELLNAEPYLTWLKEKQAKEAEDEDEYDDEDRFPFYELCDEFPDYFNCKELQAGFALNELKKDDPSVERILEAIEIYDDDEDFLLKYHPDIYQEGQEIQKLGRQQWEEQYKRRLDAKQKAREAIYHAAKKFFLENDELPPKPQKGAGEAWQKG